jgi:hypothetical protein
MKLLDRVRDAGLRRRLAGVTLDCYAQWIEQFLAVLARRRRGVATP